MNINLKGVLASLMAVGIIIVTIGATYAKTDKPVEGDCFPNPDTRNDLQVSDQNQSWQDGVTATWVANNMAPGNDYAFGGSFVGLRSNVNGGIDLTCNYKVNGATPTNAADLGNSTNSLPDEMAKQLIVTSALYKNSSWQIDLLTGKPSGMSSKDLRSYTDKRSFLWKINDIDQDGRITFYDVRHSPLTNLPLPKSTGEGARFQMRVKFAETASNDLQGDVFNLTMLYTLKQW